MPDDAAADLDDPASPRSRALVAWGNAAVAARLHDAAFAADRDRLRAVVEAEDRLIVGRRRGGHVYDFRWSAGNPRGLWRRLPADVAPTPDAPWEPVFDLDAFCRDAGQEWAWRGPVDRPDGRRVLLLLSVGGSDVLVAREFDLAAKAFVEGGFATPPCRLWVGGWDGPDAIIVSAATGPEHATRSGWPRTVRRWERGTSFDRAPVIHECDDADVGAVAFRAPGPDGPLLLVTTHTVLTGSMWVEAQGRRRLLDLPRASEKDANDRFAAWIPRGDGAHPAGSLVLRAFDGAGPGRVLVEPGPRGAVEGTFMSRDWLVATGHDDLRPWLRVLDLRPPEGPLPDLPLPDLPLPDLPLRDLPLPEGATSVQARWHAAEPDGEGPQGRDLRLDVVTEGLLRPPALLRIDLDALPAGGLAALPGPVAQEPPRFDAAGMTARLLEATSADGTRVPFHLALPREAAEGPVPVVVTAYGGFAGSVEARYLRLEGPALLERGVGWAVAHVRGGGEFGPAWHRAALRERRPRAFEDAAAVARDLVGRGIAPPGGVGFVGTSNGGLLACALAVFHPGAFGAVKANVPVTDMLRFHLYEAGAAWTEEYGDPDDPGDAAHLAAWSPLHAVRPASEVRCPPLLIDAPAHDDRVDPAHARRMAQAMRDAGQDVLLRTSEAGGHGGGETSERRAEDVALTAAFFRATLARG